LSLPLHLRFQQVVNTNHGETHPQKKSRKRSDRESLGLEHVRRDEGVPVVDGWVVTVREADAGLTLTRRIELAATNDGDAAPAKHVTVYCSADELAGFRLACAEAARAELEIANPLAGLRHYRTAALAFPFLPGLDALRDQLLSSAGNLVDASLQTAEACLKEPQMWPAARPALERVKPLIEMEDALHVAFGARFTVLMSLAERLEILAQRRPSSDDARDLLRELRDEMSTAPDGLWHTPGWRGVRERLARLEGAVRHKAAEALLEARRQFIADAGRACNDWDAGRFLEWHAQRGDLPPADESIAQLQLDEAEALLKRADALMERHREHEDAWMDADAPDETLRAAMTMLHDETGRLEAWRRDLLALIGGLHVARHTATIGLRSPAQFDIARFVLNIGGRAPATPLRQVPAMFIGHPSMLHGKAFVEACAARRALQEKLFSEITPCLQADAAAGIATCAIETTLEKLRAMRRAEPADACGLQQDLIYIDADDHLREHRGLPAIEAAVLRKVEQARAVRDWLAQAVQAGGVDWLQARHDIETLRDSGPAGLAEAQARCRRVKAGDSDGKVDSVWSLLRMCDALSHESMIAHLQTTLGENELRLCAPARALDQQRQSLWLAHERNLHECDALAQDIMLRMAQYPAMWDAFEAAYRALMSLPRWRRRRVSHSAAWLKFQQAADTFHSLCPNDSAFRVRLQEVQARFGLAPAFLDQHERFEEQHA
jgi:hypothetical protein